MTFNHLLYALSKSFKSLIQRSFIGLLDSVSRVLILDAISFFNLLIFSSVILRNCIPSKYSYPFFFELPTSLESSSSSSFALSLLSIFLSYPRDSKSVANSAVFRLLRVFPRIIEQFHITAHYFLQKATFIS